MVRLRPCTDKCNRKEGLTMATAQKKSAGKRRATSGGKRTNGTRSGSKSRSAPSRKNSSGAVPIRREVGAAICFLLAIFSALGYFHSNGLFIDFFYGLAKGLIGYGYYLLPPMLLWASIVLFFHRGRPVRLRVWCILLLPVLLGALLHMFLAKGTYEWSLTLFGALWKGGSTMACGGVLGGLLGMGFSTIFSKVGATLIFVLAATLMVLTACNTTVSNVVDYFREMPHPEYEEEPIPERPRRAPKPRESRQVCRSDIDIPADEGPLVGKKPKASPLFQRKEESFFDRKPAVPTPDQLLREDMEALETVEEMEPEEVPVPQEAPRHAPEPLPMEEDEDDWDEVEPVEEPTPVQPEPEPEEEDEDDDLRLPFDPVTPPPAPYAPARPERTSVAGIPIERMPAVGRKVEPVEAEERAKAAEEVSRDLSAGMTQEAGMPEVYQYPAVDLLQQLPGLSDSDVAGELKANQERLSDTIHSFGIDATIVDAVRGPSVTRYELELAQGVRMNKLTNLTDDIALALGATGVRIAPIPDKISMVGIEVPNKLVAPVPIRDVIDSREFRESPSKVSFAVGKDISNHCVVCNIAKLPHLLIAGTTGSGKSVCTNSLIISLLYKASPEEVRLIMVDPKMVELGIYNGIPHLLIPVVTDPKKAAGALQWAVTEMMKRYKRFSEVGVRDLKSYNALAKRTEGMDTMPSVVVVIDELADLMLVAAKEVEESICRVAQMGRASGMHLIIATQRPSADVITGLMKANIPSRIAFAVQSSLDSRIILDTTGAEKLVGRGDMLYFPLGSGKPQRVQGCMITDEEVAAVVDFVKKGGQAEYDEAVLHEIEQNAAAKDKKGNAPAAESSPEDEYDELLPNAIEVVVETGMASVSMLQRRLKLGYSRAARLVDQMEEKGVVGPFEGSKPRQVLITKAQWQEMQYRQNMPSGASPMSEPVPEELDFEDDAISQPRDLPPFDD